MQSVDFKIPWLFQRGIPFLFLLVLAEASTSQSPFVQENQAPRKARRNIDTVQTNLSELIDRIDSKINSIMYTVPNNFQPAYSVAARQLDNLELDLENVNANQKELQHSRSLLEDQVTTIGASISRLGRSSGSQSQIGELQRTVDSLKSHIAVMDSLLKSRETEKQQHQERLAAFRKSLDSTAYSHFILANQKATLQQEIFERQLAENRDLVEKFQGEIIRLEGALDSQVVGVNRTLGTDDAIKAHELHKKMYRQIADGRTLIRKLVIMTDTLDTRFKTFQNRRQRMETVLSLGLTLNQEELWKKEQEGCDLAEKSLAVTFAEIKELIDAAKNQMTMTGGSFNDYQDALGRLLKPYEPEKTSNDGELKTIAGITQPLNEEGRLVPNISLLGYKGMSNENTNWSAQLKLFVGPSSSDKSQLSSAYKIFIPEASSYGFMADFSFGFIPSNKNYKVDENTRAPIKKLGFNLGAYYLVKNLLNPADSSSFRTGVLQAKLGWQYVAIGKTLSLYANLNPFIFSDGIKTFKEHYPVRDKLNAYIDFGINAYLNPSPQLKANGFFIDFDLGFIVNSGDVQNITRTDDMLLPRIKISLVKGFNF